MLNIGKLLLFREYFAGFVAGWDYWGFGGEFFGRPAAPDRRLKPTLHWVLYSGFGDGVLGGVDLVAAPVGEVDAGEFVAVANAGVNSYFVGEINENFLERGVAENNDLAEIVLPGNKLVPYP